MRALWLTALLCLIAPAFGAQGVGPEQLYKKLLPSVMTLVVEDKDGGKRLGTAFLAIKEGLAVTAWHVVIGSKHVTARFADGEEFEVSGLVDKDERRDVALIRVKVFGRPLIPIVPAEPAVGSKAYVIGAPRGLEFSITDGLISQIQTLDGVKQLQFSCPASPGNSGGPLVNARGAILGVVSWQVSDGQNLNFAVPASYVLGLDSNLPTRPWETITATTPHERPAERAPGLYAEMRTSEGTIVIKFYEKEAPRTVQNFVGLASGTKEWTEPETGKKVKRPFYDGTVFHRVVKGFMIQGGDPLGTGIGGPGYAFDDELSPTLDYTRGTVAMANAGPNTNGSQFFIMHGDWSNRLPKNYSIFGEVVQGMEVVDKIASVETSLGSDGAMSKPLKPVRILAVTIERVRDDEPESSVGLPARER